MSPTLRRTPANGIYDVMSAGARIGEVKKVGGIGGYVQWVAWVVRDGRMHRLDGPNHGNRFSRRSDAVAAVADAVTGEKPPEESTDA